MYFSSSNIPRNIPMPKIKSYKMNIYKKYATYTFTYRSFLDTKLSKYSEYNSRKNVYWATLMFIY